MAECNNYTGLQINPTPSSIGNQYAGVSTDEKPANAPTYSVYLELDTGKFYYYDGTEWKEIPCSCNSGGGDEPSLDPFRICFSDPNLRGSVMLDGDATIAQVMDNGVFVLVPGTQCVEGVEEYPLPPKISFGYVSVPFDVKTALNGVILASVTSENPTSDPLPVGDGISYFIEGNIK